MDRPAFPRLPLLLAALCLSAPAASGAEPPPAPADGATAGAPARNLGLIGGQWPLPFGYRVGNQLVSVSETRAFSLVQSLELEAADGEREGKPVRVILEYQNAPYAPAGFIDQAMQRESETIANNPGTRGLEAVSRAGYGFTIADSLSPRPESRGEGDERVVRILASLSGFLFQVVAIDPLDDGPTDLFQSALAFEPDVPALEASRERMAEEGRRVVAGGVLRTAAGELALPEGVTATLRNAEVETGPDGLPWRVHHALMLRKDRGIRGGYVLLTATCQAIADGDGTVAKRLAGLRENFERTRGEVETQGRSAYSLGGVAVQRFDTRSRNEFGQLLATKRFYLEQDGVAILLSFDNIDGNPTQKLLDASLAGMAFGCRRETGLLAGAGKAEG